MRHKLIIRFRRRGCYKYPVYDIVLTTKKMRLSGSFKEILGFYNPNFNERLFFMNMDRLAH